MPDSKSSNLLSIIIPAHNEETELTHTLPYLLQAAKESGTPHEILLVNDASTDRTADIARSQGVAVLDVNLRQISAVRNAGAYAAKGEFILFVDADTLASAETIRMAYDAMVEGAAGGGAWVKFDDEVGWAFHAIIKIFDWIYMGLLRWAAGCFIFARRDAFEKVRGFDETLFASEEIVLSRALKKVGRFVIVPGTVITSSRKARLYPLWWPLKVSARILFRGRRALESRQNLDMWYEGKREKRNR